MPEVVSLPLIMQITLTSQVFATLSFKISALQRVANAIQAAEKKKAM